MTIADLAIHNLASFFASGNLDGVPKEVSIPAIIALCNHLFSDPG